MLLGDHSGSFLESLRALFWNHSGHFFGSTPGTFWVTLRALFGITHGHFLVALEPIWMPQSGQFLRPTPASFLARSQLLIACILGGRAVPLLAWVAA